MMQAFCASLEGKTTRSPALHYLVHEPRKLGGPRHVIVLSHALGCDLTMWNTVVPALAEECRVITYDHRGHGRSEVPEGLYTLAELADDAANLIRETEAGPIIWVGISMGGMVGQELALRHPNLVRGLVIANSTSHYPDAAQTAWQQRIITLEQQGIPGVVEATLQRFFSPSFHEKDPATVDIFRRRLLSTELAGYLGCCHAVRAIDTTDRLGQINLPVQLIASAGDQGTPVEMANVMAAHLPRARLSILPDAAHLSVIEQPQAFTETVKTYLREM